MGFFDSVGNAAKRAQLNAEMALLDREMATRKKAFGVELYDLISAQHAKNRVHADDTSMEAMVLDLPSVFKHMEKDMEEPLQKTSKEVRVMEREKRDLQQQAARIEAQKEKSFSDSAKSVELSARVAYLDREMKIKKEQFGLDAWEAAVDSKWMHETLAEGVHNAKDGLGMITGAVGGLVKGTKGTVTKTLGKLSAEEREIEQCVNKAKADVKKIQDKKDMKNRELEAIIAGKH